MTQEEKQLLLKDLSARLPYGVYIHHENFPEANLILSAVFSDGRIGVKQNKIDLTPTSINECKPYLRPMSSMTDDERDEFRVIGGVMAHNVQNDSWAIAAFTPEAYDWLNAHHFDFRGLIPMGLALEAHAGMYKTD